MSKGGAGKVYFVLYLAVILELLIIFIERDEAEEGLRRQQRQAIQIVQTILSQLQTGSGATGITASPKDNIVLSDKEPESNVRNYTVTVSVGDPKAVSVANGKTIRGDDIPKLEYIVSYLSNPDVDEAELGSDDVDIQNGTVIFKAELGTDIGSYTQPRQTFGSSIPAGETEHYFSLNEEATAAEIAKGRRVKVFGVNFKPNEGPGWYRLRFYSETNKIMGVTGSEIKDADTVRIGNVKLTVKQLRDVQKALAKERGKGESVSKVETYIERLLTPDAYRQFDENRGFTSFNVRVVRPALPPPAQPIAAISFPRDTIYWYDSAPFTVPVTLGPKEGSRDVSGGARLTPVDQARNLFAATIDNPQAGITPIIAKAMNAGMVASDEKYLVVEKPALRYKKGIDQWKGMRAIVGRKYNPTSDWMSPFIPDDHYQTVVEINGNKVFDSPGVSFKEGDLPNEMMVTEGTKTIATTVYWKPGGIADRSKWVPILSNTPGVQASIVATRPVDISYQAPEHTDGYEFDFVLTPKNLKKDFDGIILQQRLSDTRSIGVQATASCQECSDNGLSVRLIPGVDEKTWTLHVEADRAKLKPTINGKRFEVEINMTGRGGVSNTSAVIFTVKVASR